MVFLNRSFILLLLAMGMVGCSRRSANRLPSGAKSILEKADQIEVISLDPGRPEKGEKPPKGEYFGWKELGRTLIEDADTRKNVVSSVEKGIEEGDRAASCFDPRHAIHATHKGKTVDVLICFHCSQVLVYIDGERQEPYLEITKRPEPVLDKILTEANVPLAPKPMN